MTLLGSVAKHVKGHEYKVERTNLVRACEILHENGYEHLTLITGIDWQDRWEVLYHLTKFGRKNVIVLRVTLPYQDPVIPTVTSIWKGASWHERETFDLLGIEFAGTPDKRRILLPEDYVGHPLRKEVKHGNRS